MAIKLKKPKAIVMDITGTVATRAFMSYSQESRQFMKQYLREYVLESWGKRELRLALNFVRIEQEQEIKQDARTKPIPKSRYQGNTDRSESPEKQKMPLIADLRASNELQAETLINNLIWRLDNPKKNKSPALGLFHLNISEWGYKKGILKTPIYDDSAPSLQKWRQKENIKIYITLGSANFLRLVFSNTTSGDLLELVEGHMNLMEGNRKNFSRLSEMINEPPSKILYITRIPFDARLAQQSNIKTVIIVRQDFDPEAVAILKNIERKRKKKDRNRSPSVGSATGKELQTQDPVEGEETREPKATTASSSTPLIEETDLSSASKITAKDIRDFPVIQRLDDLVWE